MRRFVVLAGVFAMHLGRLVAVALGDEPAEVEQGTDEVEAVMVDVTDRDPPSEAEWDALHEDGQRAAMLGGLADFRSRTIAHMNTRYLTANPADATLASYGKMGADKRYDRFGHISGVAFSIPENSWKQRYVVNAAALMKLAGSRFMEFCGLGLDAAADKRSQIEVTFVGTTVPKDEAIRRLNTDIQALEYFDALQYKRAAHAKEKFKLFAGDAPPEPKVVLANVVMLDGNFSTALDASVDAKFHSRMTGDGVELKVTRQNGEEVTLLSPLVRCYRTYSVEFKTDGEGRPIRVALLDANGNQHVVPQVFDLTPDL